MANVPHPGNGAADPCGAPALAEGLSDYLTAVRRPPEAAVSPEAARLVADRDAHRLAWPRPAGMIVSNSYIVGKGGEIPVRIYRPAGQGAQAAILYFHGGGFMTGSIESYDCLATALAEATGASVVSVHYARLPESTPRSMLGQCVDAWRWTGRMATALRIDPARMAVAGDSAGAFLATHVAMATRDCGLPTPVCQLLCYGVYDLDPLREAYAQARDPALARPVIQSIIAAYRACEARDGTPTPAPLRAGDLSGLPPTVLLGAEYDPMAAEGADYAAALRAAGVPVEERVAPGMCHGFLRAVRFSRPAWEEMRWLAAAFHNQLRQQGSE